MSPGKAVVMCMLVGCGGGIGDAPQRLRTAIEAQRDTLEDCYGKTLQRASSSAGKMALLVRVKGGTVTDVDITANEIDDPKLDECIKATIKKVVLDRAPNRGFEVEYTVKFKPGDG